MGIGQKTRAAMITFAAKDKDTQRQFSDGQTSFPTAVLGIYVFIP